MSVENCDRCREWHRLGLSSTCPTCDLATLANFALDQKPLGPEFEAVWDANVDKLRES